MKKLYAVTICHDYSDFLAWTLPYNRTLFDKMIVVTGKSDTKTQNMCEYYNVKCIKTDVFFEDGDIFNKGKGINVGLNALPKDGWILHLDADIYLPPQFRSMFEKLKLDKDCIYGFDRLNCSGIDQWAKFMSSPRPIYKGWVYLDAKVFPVGERYVAYHDEGYIPIGFAQLWHPAHSGIFYYPTEHGYADRTDVLFAKQWSKGNRRFIPELIGIHLESEDATNGINWKGRESKPFYIEDLK